jgi:hypothetical protein
MHQLNACQRDRGGTVVSVKYLRAGDTVPMSANVGVVLAIER